MMDFFGLEHSVVEAAENLVVEGGPQTLQERVTPWRQAATVNQ